jgi:hypothetical protein
MNPYKAAAAASAITQAIAAQKLRQAAAQQAAAKQAAPAKAAPSILSQTRKRSFAAAIESVVTPEVKAVKSAEKIAQMTAPIDRILQTPSPDSAPSPFESTPSASAEPAPSFVPQTQSYVPSASASASPSYAPSASPSYYGSSSYDPNAAVEPPPFYDFDDSTDYDDGEYYDESDDEYIEEGEIMEGEAVEVGRWKLKLSKKSLKKLYAAAAKVGPIVATIYPPAAPAIGAAMLILKKANEGLPEAQNKILEIKAAAEKGDPTALQSAGLLAIAARVNDVAKQQAATGEIKPA